MLTSCGLLYAIRGKRIRKKKQLEAARNVSGATKLVSIDFFLKRKLDGIPSFAGKNINKYYSTK